MFVNSAESEPKIVILWDLIKVGEVSFPILSILIRSLAFNHIVSFRLVTN